MEPTWAKAGSVLAGIVFVLIMALVGYGQYRSEQNFKKDCVAVSGQALYDNDGDLECYRNGNEIAEHGESKPK